jgi:hypothetical protein
VLTGHFDIYFAVVGQTNFHPDPSFLIVHNNPTVFCLMLNNFCIGYSFMK